MRLRLLLNLGNSASYDLYLATTAMDTLEQRRIVQSLILFLSVLDLKAQITFLCFLHLG